MTTIHVRIHRDIQLTTDQVWPDGDAPHNPTADDVKAAMENYGYKTQVINDWCLEPTVHVAVDHGPETEVWA